VNLEGVNAVAQLIAAIGVIVSLFYLAAQIRQNTRSTRAVVVDSLAHSLVTLLAQHTQNRELLRALSVVIENWETASQDDREITLPFIFATFKLFENVWFQQRQATLDRQQWEGWDVYIRIYFHRPGVKTWWSMRKMAFAPGFRNYLEASEPVSGVMSIGEIIRAK
jgi:formyltetrahydrofolate hydrolase